MFCIDGVTPNTHTKALLYAKTLMEYDFLKRNRGTSPLEFALVECERKLVTIFQGTTGGIAFFFATVPALNWHLSFLLATISTSNFKKSEILREKAEKKELGQIWLWRFGIYFDVVFSLGGFVLFTNYLEQYLNKIRKCNVWITVTCKGNLFQDWEGTRTLLFWRNTCKIFTKARLANFKRCQSGVLIRTIF